MSGKLSVQVHDSKQGMVAQLFSPLTRETYQKLQLPVELDGKTYMVDVMIDLTTLNDD